MKEYIVKRAKGVWLTILTISLIFLFLSGDDDNDHKKENKKSGNIKGEVQQSKLEKPKSKCQLAWDKRILRSYAVFGTELRKDVKELNMERDEILQILDKYGVEPYSR